MSNLFRQALDTINPHEESWFQGRGVYGGLVFAQMAEEVSKHTIFPLRRLTVDMCAPVLAEQMSIEVKQARVGANSAFFYIACLQQDKVVAHGTAVCGGKRIGDFDQHNFVMPQPTVPTMPSIPQNPLMPKFTQHFEYWPTIGAFPFSRSKDLECGGWIRSRHDSTMDIPMALSLMDAWWPSVSLGLNGPRPMGTISFTVDFCFEESFQHSEPCLLHNTCLEVQDGYAVENNMLWSASGTLLARSQQNVVIIR
jgi:acyl-CoA thioesterase